MRKTTVALCETQPLMAEGLKQVLAPCPDLEFATALGSLAAAVERLKRDPPAVLVIDKAFGSQSVLHLLEEMRTVGVATAPIVWGISMAEAEALHFIQAGARGIIRKVSDIETFLLCLRVVARGGTWLEQNVFHEPPRLRHSVRSNLTPREQQIVELVGQGLKNREVASELGIRPGTVKVHLKHIFEKTGAQGRYSLALSSLASKLEAESGISGARFSVPLPASAGRNQPAN